MVSIEIKNLTVKFDDYIVLRDISDFISTGELYCIFGPAGCGKTTLLKAIVGLVFPQSGRVEVNGKNIFKFSQRQLLDFHKNCGFVFQNAALISNLSVYENLSLYYDYHTSLREREVKEIIQFYLDYFGFDNDINLRPASLSSGEKMIVSIVRAISHEPDFLFLDNPFSSLDVHTQRKLKKVMIEFKEKNKTVVFATSDSKTIIEIGERIAILDEGVIIEKGSKEDILNTGNEKVKEFLGI
ncbi:MAG: ABC transporter ATP-binding protein [Brevinematia bacterium]